MNAAFVGKYEDIKTYSKIFKTAYENMADKIKICGVLSTSLENTTSLAIELNAKAYLSLNDLVKECDIIFVCYTGASLAGFVNKLRSIRVRNKIICHFCPSHSSNDIETSITNTYYAISFPYTAEHDLEAALRTIVFEGGGKNRELFEEIIKCAFHNAVFTNHKNRMMCRMATRFLNTYLKMCIRLSKYIFSLAGIYEKAQFDAMAMKSLNEELSQECKHTQIEAYAVKYCMECLKEDNHPYLADYIKSNEKFLQKEEHNHDK